MTPTEMFIHRLSELKEGDRVLLRRLSCQPVDRDLGAFDLFTSLWWPLREHNAAAPRRDVSWLVAKIYCAFPVPAGATTLATALGRHEPLHPVVPDAALITSSPPSAEPAGSQFRNARSFRRRFAELLRTPLPLLEPQLRWALSVILPHARDLPTAGLDWPQLVDDLSIWDRANMSGPHENPPFRWANDYLQSHSRPQRRI